MIKYLLCALALTLPLSAHAATLSVTNTDTKTSPGSFGSYSGSNSFDLTHLQSGLRPSQSIEINSATVTFQASTPNDGSGYRPSTTSSYTYYRTVYQPQSRQRYVSRTCGGGLFQSSYECGYWEYYTVNVPVLQSERGTQTNSYRGDSSAERVFVDFGTPTDTLTDTTSGTPSTTTTFGSRNSGHYGVTRTYNSFGDMTASAMLSSAGLALLQDDLVLDYTYSVFASSRSRVPSVQTTLTVNYTIADMAPVPLNASLPLLFTGMVGLGAMARRRTKRNSV